jgi:hypothetical protein
MREEDFARIKEICKLVQKPVLSQSLYDPWIGFGFNQVSGFGPGFRVAKMTNKSIKKF